MPESFRKIVFCDKKSFFSEVPLHTESAFPTTKSDFCQIKAKNFPLSARKSKKKTFHKKDFASKRFYGHVKCNFDNSVKTLLTKGQKVLTQSPKNEELFRKKYFSSKCSYGHVERSFEHLDEKFSIKVQR